MEAQVIANSVSDMPPPGGKLGGLAGGGPSDPGLRAAFEEMMAAMFGVVNPQLMNLTGPPPVQSGEAQVLLEDASLLPGEMKHSEGMPAALPGKMMVSFVQPGQKSAPSLQEPMQASQMAPTDDVQTKEDAAPPQIYGTNHQVAPDATGGKKLGSVFFSGIPWTGEGQPTTGMEQSAVQPEGKAPTGQMEQAPTVGAANMGAALTSAVGDADKTPQTDGASRLLHASPVEQIADRVRISIDRDEQGATIQLYPKELGKVHIRLEMQNGQLHLSIQAEQHDTTRLLDGKLAELRQNLADHGIKLGELSVASSSRPGVVEGNAREASQVARAFQMDMNGDPNSHSQRQSAWAGGLNGDPQSGSRQGQRAWTFSGQEVNEVWAAERLTSSGSPRGWAADSLLGVDTYV